MTPLIGGASAGATRLAAEVRHRLGQAPAPPEWPRVSIVVLNRDGVEHLRRLLNGLRERTDYPGLELILVDNASTDGSLDFIRRAEAPFPISVLANAHNESFSDGCNRGAALASGELLLFLNNDAEPLEAGWMRELVACLRRSGAGAAGPTLIEPAGEDSPDGYRIEQRGHRVAEEGGALVPVYRDRGGDPLGEWLGEDSEVAALAAACLLIERDTFDRVGGFTSGYWYGGEDSDLALKLRERGRSIVCSGRSLLIHTPNATLNAVGADRRGEWGRGNRRLFMERWGPRVRREYELDRLHGYDMWAEPGSGPSCWGATPAQVEALGFCLKSVGLEPGLDLDALAEAIHGHRRRVGVLRGAEIGSLAAFDYDVAVCFGSPWREPPDPFRLNLRWLPPDAAPRLDDQERSRCDLVVTGEADGSREDPDRLAGRLIAAADDLALERGYRRRVIPE